MQTATVSLTVTVAEQVAVLPLLSVTVITTVLAPTLAQVNAPLFKLRLAIPQASLLPLLTCAAMTVEVPAPFKKEVTF